MESEYIWSVVVFLSHSLSTFSVDLFDYLSFISSLLFNWHSPLLSLHPLRNHISRPLLLPFPLLPPTECGCHPSIVAGEAIKQRERPEEGWETRCVCVSVWVFVWLIIIQISEEHLCKLCTHTDTRMVINLGSVVTVCVAVLNSNISDLCCVYCSFSHTHKSSCHLQGQVSVRLSAPLTQIHCMYFSVIYNIQVIFESVRCVPRTYHKCVQLKSIKLSSSILFCEK